MHPDFVRYIESLDKKVDQLLGAPVYTYDQLPKGIPKSGIYLFSEGERHLYVGRSNRIRGRLSSHCRESSRHNAASFAFRIARERTGRLKATYSREGSRGQLSEDPRFALAFTEAKRFLRGLSIRFVEERHQTVQALLEIYVAIRLKTAYNEFATH
jgi:hypothetical protein